MSIRINGKLFDSSWSRNAMEALVQELLFAGDAAIVTMSFSLALTCSEEIKIRIAHAVGSLN